MNSSLRPKFRQIAERWKARVVPGALILVYHRVAELTSDPQLLAVKSRHFAEQLEVLKREYCPMSLGAFHNAAMARKVPKRSVVVTIDDGYADSLHAAKPLLERFDLPATVFVATGSVGSWREFWWDDLERILFRTELLPEELCLCVGAATWRFNLGSAAHYGRDQFERDLQWHVEMESDPSERHVVYRALLRQLRPLPHQERRRLLDQIVSWAQAASEGRSTHRALQADELVALGKGGLIDIGAHTVTHPLLAALPIEEQRKEIAESKRNLEEVTGVKVSHFAYPFGGRGDFTEETQAMVEAAGFSNGCANYPGIVWSGRNRYRWPRNLVRDWNGDEFSRRLMEWSGG